MHRMSYLILSIIGFVFAAQTMAFPQVAAGLFADDWVLEKDRFSGDWEENDSWRGKLCNGHYNYGIEADGRIGTLDFEMTESGYIEVYGDLRDVDGKLKGNYRSGYSACVPIGGAIRAEIDRFEAWGKLWLVEKDGSFDVKVRLTKTKLHRVYFSKYLPDWFENFLTKLLNKALNYIWTTSLGEMIGDKIGEAMKEHLPDQMV